MAKGSRNTRMSLSSKSGAEAEYVPNTPQGVQFVKKQLLEYVPMNKWNNHTDYAMGFNADAQNVVEKIAKGDYGFATKVAQTVVNSPNWDKYGYKLSEKQAYILADAAVKNKLITQEKGSIFKMPTKEEIMKKKQKKMKLADIHAGLLELEGKTGYYGNDGNTTQRKIKN